MSERSCVKMPHKYLSKLQELFCILVTFRVSYEISVNENVPR